MELVHARARRRMSRGLKQKPMGLIKRLRKAKKSECEPLRTGLRALVKYIVKRVEQEKEGLEGNL